MPRFGAIRSQPHPIALRDGIRFSATPQQVAALPAQIDLRIDVGGYANFDVYNQGNYGSCTANAIAGAFQFCEIELGSENVFTPSRLFIYYEARRRDAQSAGQPFDPAADIGSTITEGVNVVFLEGAPMETDWPYSEPISQQPSDSVFASAANHKVLEWKAIPVDRDQLRACLGNGFPFLFGFEPHVAMLDPAFNGILPMPTGPQDIVHDPRTGQPEGHAVLAIGYNDNDDGGRFLARNSWGPTSGLNGYFTIPYDYVLSPIYGDSGFWTLRVVQ